MADDTTKGHAVIAAMTGAETRIWSMWTDLDDPNVVVVNHGSARKHRRAVVESRANETGVGDIPYFRDVSNALSSANSIILLGHGTGSSNVARAFVGWVHDHVPALWGRIVRVDDCDIPALTDSQLRDLGRRIWRAQGA